jgi:hypothetical protein
MILRSLAVPALACAAVVAADDAGFRFERDFTLEDLETGRDIEERIYYSREGGEFDEWRFQFGASPAIDKVQVKTQLAGLSYPGPPNVETDRAISRPATPPTFELWWLLGDFEVRDEGWIYGVALDYTYRGYKILYAVGTDSQYLDIHQVGVKLSYAYAWYLEQHLRLECGPLLGTGLMFAQHDVIDMDSGYPKPGTGGGVYVQGGVRTSLLWHPGASQKWQVGATVDYLSGYGYTNYKTEGVLGDVQSELRFWWYGFALSGFIGKRF